MKQNRRLVLAWIIALGFVAFGVLANWYMVYVLAEQSLAVKETLNPYQELYDELLYPSVRIVTDEGIGSGVVISSTGYATYILTAAHVVGNKALVTVELFNSAETLPAFVVATDTGKDLALLRCASGVLSHASKTQDPRLTTPWRYTAKLAPNDYVPYIFTPIWVIGCSLGYPPRPTEGCITALGDLGVSAVRYWEMNAPIWPGNSGGGVFRKDTHELIGIAVWVKVCHGQLASTMGGIVPLYEIYNFIDRLGVNGDRLAVPGTGDHQPNPDNQTPQTKRGGD
jgi:S1-C subfamily serine protease